MKKIAKLSLVAAIAVSVAIASPVETKVETVQPVAQVQKVETSDKMKAYLEKASAWTSTKVDEATVASKKAYEFVKKEATELYEDIKASQADTEATKTEKPM